MVRGSRRLNASRVGPRPRSLRLIAMLVLFLFAPASFSDETPSPKTLSYKNPGILVIHSYSEFFPWNQSFTTGMRHWLQKNTEPLLAKPLLIKPLPTEPLPIKPDTTRQNVQPTVFREYLFAHTLNPAPDSSFWINYFRTKYKNTPIYAIIGESEEAAELVYRHGHEIAPDAIQVLHTSNVYSLNPRQVNLTNDMAAVAAHTAELALRQNPHARLCLVIDGDNPVSDVMVRAYREALAKENQCKTEILADFSLSDLEQKITNLPDAAIIFYTLVFSDKTGQTFTPRKVLQRVASLAHAPVYANYSTLMGNGAVGGYVVDGQTLAKSAFQAVQDFWRDGRFSPQGYSSVIPMFDWNALQAHDIDERSLPEGSRLIHRPATFIQRYRNAIITWLALLAAALLLTLLRLGHLSGMTRKLREINEKLLEKELALQRINKELNDMAMRDPLTHLHNRRAMIPLIDEAFRRSNRHGTPACLVLCDIDHFKGINDRLGHQTGDAALIFVAQLLVNTVRASDSVARWGGEEFLILLPETPLDHGTILAEKIRAQIAAAQFLHGEHRITVSVSIVALGAGMSFNACFEALDAALYDAKTAGRNRVKVAHYNIDAARP